MGWAKRAKKKAESEGRAGTGLAGAAEQSAAQDACGLCGKRRKNLTRTECCGRLICDDEGEYRMFSYARSSCSRNHRRYTLCGFHHNEGHRGEWPDCARCRREFETKMYVYYGTNAYNFERLKAPPAYAPTHCRGCGRVISLGEDAYERHPDGSYACADCWED